MPGSNDAINQAIRAARGEQLDLSDHAAVNRAIRTAAGRDPGPGREDRPAAPTFSQADYRVRQTEPSPGTSSVRVWNEWAWKHAAGLLDRHGRLPGESGYDASTSGRGDAEGYDMVGAVAARKRRWRERDALVREVDSDE